MSQFNGSQIKVQSFINEFNDFADHCHNLSVQKGWWTEEGRNDGELLALIHSEVSEALEALRHGNPPDDKIPNFNGAVAELADVVIRCMDMASARGWDGSSKNSSNGER